MDGINQLVVVYVTAAHMFLSMMVVITESRKKTSFSYTYRTN
jgi:hypothetical protein